MPPNRPGAPIRAGQSMRLETPGGGGFGPPGERDPDAIARDLIGGKVSRDAVRRGYGEALLAQAEALVAQWGGRSPPMAPKL